MTWEAVGDKIKCKRCDSVNLKYRIIEDSDCHEDINYWCPDCNYSWWVEGSEKLMKRSLSVSGY
jgi:transposase-like protein